jgi:hypothetical protein
MGSITVYIIVGVIGYILAKQINDTSFEHGLNLGPHKSHGTGDDIDMFHVYGDVEQDFQETLLSHSDRCIHRPPELWGL